MVYYQWEKFINNSKPKKHIDQWKPDFGAVKEDGKVRISVLVDNPRTHVYLVGDFNGWGKKDLEQYELEHDNNSLFATIRTDKLKHRDPYKLLVKCGSYEMYMQDPAAHYFDDNGNCIFWDPDKGYKQKHEFIDTIHRSTRILQTDLPGLIVHWADKNGRLGHEVPPREYYRFITESGILKHVKDLGFNTIQFLPFAQSIDGDNWKFRYLVPFQFAIQKNWGTPDEFARMIDECHRHGIAVIGDFVIGHLPFKDYSVFGQNGESNGIQNWINRHGSRVYMKEETPWGTMRVDFDSEHVRKYIIHSCLYFLKHYKVDGLRIDNVDGIIRYGANGEGEERPNGRRFLRELTSTLYNYNPFALIHFEAHYFYKDNAKMLVVPHELDDRALGATAYNSSRMTYYFHTEYMPKAADKITPWKFKDITEEKEWGQSNSTVADFHNHDAAAGLMEMRCTGSYAYDTMTCKQPGNHHHAVGKIKVMEGIISFCGEGRTLDLIQSFLLQTGTFEHDSSIKWQLTFVQCSKNMVEYKRKVNEIMEDPAFWPMYTKNRKFLNVDDKNKVMVIERSAEHEGKKSKYVIVFNLSSWVHYDYKVGVVGKNDYEVVLNSDLFEYAGNGMSAYPEVLKNIHSHNFELLDREVVLSKLAPYGVVVLRELGK